MPHRPRQLKRLSALTLAPLLVALAGCTSWIPDQKVGDPLGLAGTELTLVSSALMTAPEAASLKGEEFRPATVFYPTPPVQAPPPPPGGWLSPEDVDALIGHANAGIDADFDPPPPPPGNLDRDQDRSVLQQMLDERRRERQGAGDDARDRNSALLQMIEEQRRQQQRALEQARDEEERRARERMMQRLDEMDRGARGAMQATADRPGTDRPAWFAPPTWQVSVSPGMFDGVPQMVLNGVKDFSQEVSLVELRWLGAQPPEVIVLHGYALGVMVLKEGSDEILANPSARVALADPLVLVRHGDTDAYSATGPVPDLEFGLSRDEAQALVRAMDEGSDLSVVFDVALLMAPGIPADGGVTITLGAGEATVKF